MLIQHVIVRVFKFFKFHFYILSKLILEFLIVVFCFNSLSCFNQAKQWAFRKWRKLNFRLNFCYFLFKKWRSLSNGYVGFKRQSNCFFLGNLKLLYFLKFLFSHLWTLYLTDFNLLYIVIDQLYMFLFMIGFFLMTTVSHSEVL